MKKERKKITLRRALLVSLLTYRVFPFSRKRKNKTKNNRPFRKTDFQPFSHSQSELLKQLLNLLPIYYIL